MAAAPLGSCVLVRRLPSPKASLVTVVLANIDRGATWTLRDAIAKRAEAQPGVVGGECENGGIS
jgi:hypothetical protein